MKFENIKTGDKVSVRIMAVVPETFPGRPKKVKSVKRCEKYISYKAETRKQKEFLCKAINWPAEGYEAEKRRAKARRNKQIGKS